VNFEKALKEQKIKTLTTKKSVTICKDTTFSETVHQLQEARSGCAVVLQDKKVIGIFTEKDVLQRGLLKKVDPKTPISQLMTSDPMVLDMEDTLAVAIRLMHDGKYRHLPIVNSQLEFLGLVSVRDIVFYLSENYPYEVLNQPPDPHKISASAEGA
jgi:CBS domain-containing protein